MRHASCKREGGSVKLVSAALITVVALGLVAAAGPASAGKPAQAEKAGRTGPPGKGKGKNPLRGRYAGTTEEGGTVSFRIAQSGRVFDFVAGPTTLVCPQLAIDPLTGQLTAYPPTVLTTTATVFADASFLRLTKEVPGYPKGKRFDYYGPGGNPHGDGVSIFGKLAKGFRGMEGAFYLKDVHSGSDTCRMRPNGVLGGFGLVSWDARKVGG
jgi:hypothetical protein